MKTLFRAIALALFLPAAASAQELPGSTLGKNGGNPPISARNMVTPIVTTHCPIDGVYEISQLITIATNEGRNDVAVAAVGLLLAGMEEPWVVAFLRAALTDICAAP